MKGEDGSGLRAPGFGLRVESGTRSFTRSLEPGAWRLEPELHTNQPRALAQSTRAKSSAANGKSSSR
jgi:hypothetical protein